MDVLVQMSGRRFQWPRTGAGEAICQRCGAPIWYVLTHKQKRIPVDLPFLGVARCHYDTCSKTGPRV